MDEWPPSFNIEYINLILIQQNKIPGHKSKVKCDIELANKGQIEKIDERKLYLKNIMAFDGRVCVINGAPGVGKTRLVLKLCKDWAAGQLLTNFHLVLYVALREPIARLSENIDELLNYFGNNCNEGDRELIKKEQGKGVLFILDGWDELRPSCRGESQFFPKLIKGSFLPGCSVIVTSRPGASRNIRCHAHRIVEVLGFGKKQVEEYIQACFTCDGTSKLINDLQKYPNIASTCYVAINLAIVCYVYHALGYSLPETLTEVYKWFIIHTVQRYLKKKKVAEEIHLDEELVVDSTKDFFDSSDFDETVKNIFKESVKDMLQKLGELALNGLAKDDLCFCRRDLVETCNLDIDDHQFDGFGLLKPVHMCLSARLETYYHFLHLSIQEFIAAFYISQMDASEQMRWLIHDKRYDAVIKFFCGIDEFKSQALRIFLKNAKPIRLFHFECVYEGQWKDHCKAIAYQCSHTFTLSAILQPQQWEVLGYVMSNSETQWHFECRSQFLEKENLTCFSRRLSNDRAISHLSLEKMCISPCAIIHLSKICQLQLALAKLDIINCDLSDEDLSTFSRNIEHHPSLERLYIEDKTVTPQVLNAFLKLLPTLPVIKDVELKFRNFSNQNYLAIKQCASGCKASPNIFIPKEFLSCGNAEMRTCNQDQIEGEHF